MAVSQVDLNGELAAAWRYRTRVPTVGRLLALRETGPVGHCSRTVLLGWSKKRHSLALKVLECPLRRTVLSLEITVMAVSLKNM